MNVIDRIPNSSSEDSIFRAFKNQIINFLTRDVYEGEMFTHAYTNSPTGEGKAITALIYIDAINCIQEKESLITYYGEGHSEDLTYLYNQQKNAIGLVTVITATNAIETYLPEDRQELEGAQEALKETHDHTLKIFKSPNNNALYVLTNRSLKIETLYKLKQLQNKMDANVVSNFNPLTTDAYDALVKNDINKLNEALAKIRSSKEFKERNFVRFLDQFSRTDRFKLENLQNEIKQQHQNILYWENEIAKCGTSIKQLNEQIILHKKGTKSDEDIKDLYNLLNKSPYIKNYRFVDSDKIRLKYYAPLLYFSDYAISQIYDSYEEIAEEQAILDLFRNKRFQLYTHCEIDFNIIDFTTKIHFIDTSDCAYLSHPHINEYGCFGNHREAIDDAAISRNYVGAIDQLSQAVLNMNFYDACVTNKMLELLLDYPPYDDMETWYDTVTGEFVTVHEAIERSKHEETETE